MKNRKDKNAERRRSRNIINGLIILGVVLVFLAIAVLFGQNTSPQQVALPQIGKPFSEFSLTNLEGKPVHLSDYKGKTVLINAWATWCPPCKAEMPDLNAYYLAHKDQGFVILAINAGDPAPDAAAFASEKGLSFPVLLDPNSNLLTSLGIDSFPTSILIGTDGVVKVIHIGLFTPQAMAAELTPNLPR